MVAIHGYHDRILRVDLTAGAWAAEAPGAALWRAYLGGGGLGACYLLREVPPGADPLGAANKLFLMTSVLNGAPLSGLNRYSAIAKSPLTGGYGESEAGGYWGPELKAAGFDGIALEGAAAHPVYLWVHDGTCEIRDARHLWGRLADEVQHTLEGEHGSRVRVLQTGVAGERRVRYAALVNQQRHFHGRGGLGAVLGAKNLKAIVCRGTQRLRPADPEAFKQVLRWWREHYDQSTDRRHLYGTAGIAPALDADGILPTRNFRDGHFEQVGEISGQRMSETILKNAGTCFACAVACKREVEVAERGVTVEYGGPEYETVAAHG